MGSLTSRPTSVPSPTPQVVYVPAPTTTTSVSTPTTTVDATPTTTSPDTEAAAQAQREENLLRRDRGRSGTIQTGFRGILSAVDTAAQKKTLLGQ